MSYTSGFMIGTTIGKTLYDMVHKKRKTPGTVMQKVMPTRAAYTVQGTSQVQAAQPIQKVPRFMCISAVNGRRRYRAAEVVGNESLARLIEQKLGQIRGISSVEVNSRQYSHPFQR